MNITETRILNERQKEQVLLLWNNEYPAQVSYSHLPDLNKYLDGLIQKNHFLLTDATENIKGWLFVFERAGEDWFALLVDETIQGLGYGTQLLDLAKSKFSVLNGWAIDHNNDLKTNGAVYRSPLGFYEKNGFTIEPGQKFPTDILSAVKIYWKR